MDKESPSSRHHEHPHEVSHSQAVFQEQSSQHHAMEGVVSLAKIAKSAPTQNASAPKGFPSQSKSASECASM